jgi:cobalt-zinc-cadmium efflux system protein
MPGVPDFGRAFAIGALLNIAFVVIEALAGFFANSVALLADAGHNLSDVLGLLMSWGAFALARRRPTRRFTYGYGSTTILAALANAVLLLVAVGAIALEAVRRFADPSPVASGTVIAVAAAGIVVNGLTASLFASGRHGDVNLRSAFLHMASDAAISCGVVAAGFAIMITGWNQIDPAVSLIVGAVIVWGTWGLLRDATTLAMHGVPEGIDPAQVRKRLSALPGVTDLHDLHIWPMSTTETALTCHLVMPDGHPGDGFLLETARMLQQEFAIGHATLQIEVERSSTCALEDACTACRESPS